jgi:hypothetical protein
MIRPQEFIVLDILVDNKSSIKVARLFIYLQQTETINNVDHRGRKTSKSTTTTLNRVIWNGVCFLLKALPNLNVTFD